MKKSITNVFLLIAVLTPIVISCHKTQEEDIEQLKKEALNNYAGLVLANYEDCYQSVVDYKQSVETFLQNPTASGLEQCKSAWLFARKPYGQSEAFRFYGGPIDNGQGPEGLINAWPMDEVYVDYVVGNPNAGVINNPGQYPDINKNLLVGLNELLSEKSIFTGYHTAEFLLWGQDLSASGPGNRPYTDYVTDGSGTAANQDRRGQYLTVVNELLLEHLNQVLTQWTDTGDYRQKFLNTYETKKSLGLIFSGLVEFTSGEIAGERMFVAIDLQDQEHEHSCFSDNTINDLKANLEGVKNVYFGKYKRIDGSEHSGRSFADILIKIDSNLALEVLNAIDLAELKLSLIPAPFDQTILNNTTPVQEAIDALNALSDQLYLAGKALGGEF